MFNDMYFFRNFCLTNFPFIEREFDALTEYEIICKILEYFKNKIDEVDEKYANFGEEVNSLKQEFIKLKSDISLILDNFEVSILNKVDLKNQQNYNEILRLLNNYQIVFDNKIADLKIELEQKIQEIELGNVKAYNPTTGLIENISKVISDIYETLRNNAITVTEFEALELMASEFDNKEITAYNFDVNSKTFLLNN